MSKVTLFKKVRLELLLENINRRGCFQFHWERVPQAWGSYGEGSFTIRLQVIIRSFKQTF